MTKVLLKYVGPFAEVEIAATGDEVANGELVEVDADLAGTEPGDATGIEGADDYAPGHPGSGLLAQPENWKRATAAEAKAHAKRAGAEDTTSTPTSTPDLAGDGTSQE